jgi:hypothetical protein
MWKLSSGSYHWEGLAGLESDGPVVPPYAVERQDEWAYSLVLK